jgi:fatty-acyl-CoA synthase
MNHLLTISDSVYVFARHTPNKLGARDSKRHLSYVEWNQRASQLASALLGLGLKKGDRIGVIAYNCLEWMEIYVAMARAGLVVVPLNFRLNAPEIAYILDNAEVSAVIAGTEFCKTIDSIRNELAIPSANFIALSGDDVANWQRYESIIANARANDSRNIAAILPVVRPDDSCALMYTSGTTGRPKGAIRSHEGSTLIALATALEMGFTAEDTALLVMPLCHANSLYFATTFIHRGGTCIIDDRRSFDPAALLKTLAEDRVTFTSLVPTHYIMLLALPDEVKRRYDLSAVGKLMISSAPARQDTKRGIMSLFPNGKLYELYGSTEAGWVTLLRPDEQLRKLGSVGREWAGSGAIRLLDESRREVADGEVGELFSRTPYVFDGYWKNPEKTAEAFDGVWCSVGDMARRDDEGYIWLVDRKSNMIISGGENIYPSEIEGVLGQHPKVRDVAVIGVPHEKWGETAKAIVVLHQDQVATTQEMRDWCRQRLASFKCPSDVVFIDDTDMPRTATGKILHRVLRQRDAKPSVVA